MSTLRLLLVEDSENDALLITDQLTQAGYEVKADRVETRAALEDALHDCQYDAIIVDYRLPGFTGLDALKVIQNKDRYCPCIIVSGVIDEETAVSAMRAGAQDYVLKGNLARLVPAVERELRETEIRRQREEARRAYDEEHRRLEAVLAAMPVGVFIADAEGRIVEVNDQAARIWHGHPPTAGTTKDYAAYRGWQPGSTEPLKTDEWGLARALHSGEVSTGELVRIERVDGSLGTILNSAAPIRDANGRIIGGVATNQDVTELIELRDELQEALDREKRYSLLLQRALLPEAPAIGEGFEVAAEYVPVYEEREIGGDFYDVWPMGRDRAGVLIGDVAGKGLGAAALGATTRSTIHALVHRLGTASAALTSANSVLLADSSRSDAFVTVYLVLIETTNGGIAYSGAGHPPPIIRRAGGNVEELETGGVPLGVTESARYSDAHSLLRPGDKLILYTDGVSEARHLGRMLGSVRIMQLIEEQGHQPAKTLAHCIISAATNWTGGHLQDDAEVVVVERLPQS